MTLDEYLEMVTSEGFISGMTSRYPWITREQIARFNESYYLCMTNPEYRKAKKELEARIIAGTDRTRHTLR